MNELAASFKRLTVQAASFQKIDNETFLNIARFLTGNGTQYGCQGNLRIFTVCHHFRAMQHLFFERFANACVNSIVQRFCSGDFDEMHFKRIETIPQLLWKQVQAVAHKVISIDLRHACCLNSWDVEKIAELRHIQSFQFHGQMRTSISQFTELPQLRRIKLSVKNTLSLVTEDIEQLQELEHLEEVDLECEELQTPNGHQHILNAEKVGKLTHLPKVKRLSCITRYESIREIFHRFIKTAGQYEQLALGSVHQIAEPEFEQFFQAQRQLRSLELQFPEQLTDQAISSLCSTLVDLEKLKLTFSNPWCSKVRCTGNGFKDLYKLKKLQNFEISLPWHPGEQILAFCQALSKVENLKRFWCPNTESSFTSTDLHALEPGLFQLESFHCSIGIVDKSVLESFLKSKPNLKTLHLRLPNNQLGDCLQCCTHLKRLESLHLEPVYSLKSEDVVHLADLKELCEVTFSIGEELFRNQITTAIEPLKKLRPDITIKVV